MTTRKHLMTLLAALLALAVAGCSDDKPSDENKTPDAGKQTDEKCFGRTCPAETYCNLETQECDYICNADGHGCNELEICDVDNKEFPNGQKPCLPMKCGGNTCEFGQGCFDPLNDWATGAQDCTCRPTLTDDAGDVVYTDTCEPYGLVCGYDPNIGGPAKCRKPGEMERCDPEVGCDQSGGKLNCRTLPNGNSLCLRQCESTDQCTDVRMKCYPTNNPQLAPALRGHCFYNYCAEDDNPDKYFQPCDAEGLGVTNEGTCIPIPVNALGEVVGLCYAAGTAPSLGQCDPRADRRNLDGVCPFNELCTSVQPDATGRKSVGVCRKLCNGAPGPNPRPNPAEKPEAACGEDSAGDTCVDGTGLTHPNANKTVRLGLCQYTCDLFGTDQCPAQDGLGNPLGCYPSFEEGKGWCRATRADAGGYNDPCEFATNQYERRNTCGDRAVCLGSPAQGIEQRCYGFCNLEACGDPTTTPCADCQGLTCKTSSQTCTPKCEGKPCGDDGCGGVCPNTCDPETQICKNSQCVSNTETCQPDCVFKNCGYDGCDGKCGECASGKVCAPVGEDFRCYPLAQDQDHPVGLCVPKLGQ